MDGRSTGTTRTGSYLIQHYMLLQRNLLNKAGTRGKRLVLLVGTRKALAIAVKRVESQQRITTLRRRLQMTISWLP